MGYSSHMSEAAGGSSGSNGRDGFGRGVTANQKATIRAFDKFYSMFPSFLDLFPDEDAFLDFVFYFFILTIITVCILAKFVKIKPSSYF